MKTRIVGVRALPREKFDAFYRGGHRWPVAGRTVEVTDELFAVLRRELFLSVDLEPEGEPETGVLSLIDNFCGDRAHNAQAETREKMKALEAEKASLEAAAKVAALEAEVLALRAKVAKPEKPKAEKPAAEPKA
jgi:hypothetical protein